MTALVVVALLALLLMAAGAAVGAAFQDKLNEGQRRRTAHRLSEVHAMRRTLENHAATFELAWPNRRWAVPVAIHADDSD